MGSLPQRAFSHSNLEIQPKLDDSGSKRIHRSASSLQSLCQSIRTFSAFEREVATKAVMFSLDTIYTRAPSSSRRIPHIARSLFFVLYTSLLFVRRILPGSRLRGRRDEE